MFGRLKHISFLLALALSLSFVLPAVAQTDTEKENSAIEPLTAAEFAQQAETSEGNRAALALSNAESNDMIVCGSTDVVCDTKSQYCLKCAYFTTTAGAPTEVVNGKCVPKKGADTKNLRSLWPADDQCPEEGDGALLQKLYGGAQDIVITIENKHFFNDGGIWTPATDWVRETHQFGDSKGRQYTLVTGKNPTIHYAGKDSSFSGCEVFPVKLHNIRGCFFCPLARLIFDTSNEMTKKSFSYFAEGFIAILVVMFAIWLALAALQQVFSMTKQDAPKFLSAIVKQGFKFLLAILLLANSNTLFDYFIVPVLSGGLAIGQNIQTEDVKLEKNYEPKISSTSADYFNITQADGTGLYQKIDAYLTNLQGKIAYMQAVGTTLFCVGGHELFSGKPGEEMLRNFKSGLGLMFLGAILTVFGFLLTISFGFYFLDAILQLAILGVMLPFMIAGWPFKATAQYASTGFSMLLNTFFVMFFTGFVVSVCLVLVDNALQTGRTSNIAKSLLSEFAEAFNEQNIERVRELADIGGSGFLLLIFACLFGFKFVGQVTPLAGKLASGGLKPLAGKIGTMAASATKGMAAKVTAPVRQGFEKATGGVMGIAAGTAGGIARAAGSVAGAVGKGLSKGGEALSKKGKVGKAAGWVVNKAGQVASGLGKGASGVGNIGKKVQQAYKDEANRPKK